MNMLRVKKAKTFEKKIKLTIFPCQQCTTVAINTSARHSGLDIFDKTKKIHAENCYYRVYYIFRSNNSQNLQFDQMKGNGIG
jgi:hypothetical protein